VTAQEVVTPIRVVAEPRRPSVVRLGIVLLVTALNLRMAVAALSPVLDQVQRDTGLSSTAAGLLSTVPVLCFGLFALVTPPLIRRLGMERLLLLTLVVITAGIALRVLPPVVALFAGTAVLGMGIAIGNVLLPGLIKQDFARHAGLMTGLYSVSLFVGPAISAGLTIPLMHLTGFGWRPTIALWGGLAVICMGLLAPHAVSRPAVPRPVVPPQPGPPQPGPGQTGPLRTDPFQTGPLRVKRRGLWSDPMAWMVAGFMGLQSLGYYSGVAWIPTLLEAHHMSAGQAGWMLSYSSFPGLAAALATPLLIRGRAPRAAAMVVAATVACGIGYVGLAIAPVAMPYVWLTILGLGQGMCISLALGFIVARAPDVHQTARLSTMAQGVGYLIASAGPFGLGALHDFSGGWTVPMLALTGILLPILITGLGASRDRHILERRRAGAHRKH
jgi:MFS transporter, CP family, cyanate transporter